MKRCAQKMFFSSGGFTLLEVLIVVVIAVLVTMFAVPSYRRAQERNRFLSATGVLMEVANAASMLHENYPDINYSASLTANSSSAGTCPEEPTSSNVLRFLQCRKYLSEIPFSNRTYQGYSFKISTQGTATCTGCGGQGWACMYNTSALQKQYKCAYIDKSGNLHNT